MNIKIEKTPIQDVCVLKPDVFQDARGIFTELFKFQHLKDQGLEIVVKQYNYSRSAKNILRGLHFQYDPPMGKLMRVVSGRAFLVAVDLRKKSPTLGKWFGKVMSPDTIELLWAPGCFARGFCVLSDFADIEYLCSSEYNKNGESGILWNDPAVGVEWPVTEPILSDKDGKAQTLTDWLKTPQSDLF
jgi:dTDP-4-dehydrorhamnose 3,5-epimerase